jgi:hypothetical protein
MLWDAGVIADEVAAWAWWLLAINYQDVESIAEAQFDLELKQLLAQGGLICRRSLA